MDNLLAQQWALLEAHFDRHARVIARFRHAERPAVLRMWQSQTNESGNPLTPLEREALVERHCELFGTWPERERERVTAPPRDRAKAKASSKSVGARDYLQLDG